MVYLLERLWLKKRPLCWYHTFSSIYIYIIHNEISLGFGVSPSVQQLLNCHLFQMLLQVCHSEVLYLVSTQSKFMIISYMRLCWVMFHIFTEHHGKWMKILSYFGIYYPLNILKHPSWTSAAEDSKTRSGILPGELSLRLSLGSRAGWRSWFCVYFSDQHTYIYNIYIFPSISPFIYHIYQQLDIIYILCIYIPQVEYIPHRMKHFWLP